MLNTIQEICDELNNLKKILFYFLDFQIFTIEFPADANHFPSSVNLTDSIESLWRLKFFMIIPVTKYHIFMSLLDPSVIM